jgi:filamentous hemagglutinin family protein
VALNDAPAQVATTIKTDASWSRTPAAVVPGGPAIVTANRASYAVSGNVYAIPQTLGKAAGPNLFHSFETFSVGSGDAAVFTTTSSFNNVISRVSGAAPSSIQGLLALVPAAGSKPNFFFINPNGITFGAGAQVDVPAAFHVSTSNELRFSDGTSFKAGAGSDSTLTIAPPTAFGFLGTTRAPIAFGDGVVLETVPGAGMSIAGGDVQIGNAFLLTQGGGDVRIAAVGSDAAVVPLTGALPAAQGTFTMVDGAAIWALSLGSQRGGEVAVSAGDITIEGQPNESGFATISTVGMFNSRGRAGDIVMSAAGRLSMANGALMSSSYFTGDSGAITVSANTMLLDGRGLDVGIDLLDNVIQTGIQSGTYGIGTPGRVGAITVNVAGELKIVNGAELYSTSAGRNKAGTIQVRAGSMSSDARNSPLTTGIYSYARASSGAGADIDVALDGVLGLRDGAALATFAQADGAAGSVKVAAQDVYITTRNSPGVSGIYSAAQPGSRGRSGNLDIVARDGLAIVQGGLIASVPQSSGAGGSIRVRAENLTLDRGDGPHANAIITENDGDGNTGSINVEVGSQLSILNGARISSVTFFRGNAGNIDVQAGNMLIDAGDQAFDTGIIADATLGSTGRGGNVGLSVKGALSIRNGGVISASTNSPGDAGSVQVDAANITIDDLGSRRHTGIFSTAGLGFGDEGNGGNIAVTATGSLSVLGSATIASSASGRGKAGSLTLNAHDILIDPRGDKEAPGVQASVGRQAGDAGDISVSAESLTIVRGGALTSVTFSTRGRSGSVKVDTGTLVIDGDGSHISADAEDISSGQTGNLTVTASRSIALSNGGRLSIRNEANVPDPSALVPTLLSVSAPTISLKDAQISAESLGSVAASDVVVHFTDRLMLDPSHITSSAKVGNGGSISIDGNGLLMLDRSSITTSAGPSGNGGDISIHTGALVMNGGFIQANTEGVGARGGNVAIDVRTFVPSGSVVLIGGATPLVFQPNSALNVIQAAAPTGVSGAIEVSTPVTDISGSLHRLSTEVVTFGRLGKDLCRVGASSSLTPLGRGGMRATASGLLRPEGPIVIAAAERIDAKRPDEPAGEAAAQPASLRCER